MPTFGEHIRNRRKELGMTLKDAALCLNIATQYLGTIELGQSRPPPDDLLERMAGLFDFDPVELYFLAGRLPPDMHRAVLEEPGLVWVIYERFVQNERKG